MNEEQKQSIIKIYNASVERMQNLPIPEWEERERTAQDEKSRKRAQSKLERLSVQESFELGTQNGIDAAMSAINYTLILDDEDFAIDIIEEDFAIDIE